MAIKIKYLKNYNETKGNYINISIHITMKSTYLNSFLVYIKYFHNYNNMNEIIYIVILRRLSKRSYLLHFA